MNAIDSLGHTLQKQMRRSAAANKDIASELGMINEDLSLTVPSLKNKIPKGSYMVSLHLKNTVTAIDTTINENHIHKVSLPTDLRGLQAGDRVIVAWVGTEPIVIDIVVSS